MKNLISLIEQNKIFGWSKNNGGVERSRIEAVCSVVDDGGGIAAVSLALTCPEYS